MGAGVLALAGIAGACSGKHSAPRRSASADPCRIGPVTEQPIPLEASAIRPPIVDASKFRTTTPIKHVVFIMKENRSFDNLFGAFPGANGAATGMQGDKEVPLRTHCFPQALPKDITHDYPTALRNWNRGEMNGFGATPFTAEWAYTQAEQKDIPNYWRWAQDFSLGDNFFASAMGPSFPNHMWSFAGSSAKTHDNPVQAEGQMVNKLTPSGVYQKSWGCDAPKGTHILLDHGSGTVTPDGFDAYLDLWDSLQDPDVDPARRSHGQVTEKFPCFDLQVLPDILKSAGIPWAYYGADDTQLGYFWDTPDYINHIRRDTMAWESRVFGINQIVPDIQDGRLPPVTWVTPQFWLSDHPDANLCNGENWTTQLVNAIMEGPAWKDTAIFIVWDDWGGFYDHVPPPQIDRFGLGFRVPVMTISPYAKRGFIDSKQGDFSSILRFIEYNWRIPSLGRGDARTNNDMTQNFDFTQTPLAPDALPLRHDCQQFPDERAYNFGGS